MSHTPGPWTYDGHGTVEGPNYVICFFVHGFEDGAKAGADANGHLIAAAPDLLAALEGMLADYAQIRDDDEFAEMEAIIAKARAAIAKAKGR